MKHKCSSQQNPEVLYHRDAELHVVWAENKKIIIFVTIDEDKIQET